MSKDKILLVDDEDSFVRTLAERLQARGLSVECAKNGREALNKINEHRFHAILLDLVMPGLDGLETLRLLKKINPTVQVIMLTGHATVKKSVAAMKLGAADFLEKTTGFQELLTKIEAAIAKTAFLKEKQIENQIVDIMIRNSW